jgi:hypothetical protein
MNDTPIPAIGMPGPFEWLCILVFFGLFLGGIALIVRLARGPKVPPRGFDVRVRSDDDRDDQRQA